MQSGLENGKRSLYEDRVSERDSMRDAPRWLVWLMTFINRVGFPIAISLYLIYMQMRAMPALTETIQAMNSTLGHVEIALRDNTEVLRTIHR